MNLFGKPVIVIGNGVRASGADASRLLDLGVPILSSWSGADLVDNWHPMYFGRPGIYGQRCANRILYEADEIIGVGCRFGPYMIGHAGFRPEQKLTMVDVDASEAAKFNATHIHMDVKDFIASFAPTVSCLSWVKQCERWKAKWDTVEYPAHDDTNGYINSYQFMRRLQPFLRPDEVIVIDNGCLTCPPFQVLKLKPPQRMMTTGNLGEMGAGLPGAIGASFARGKGEVLAFIGDGGMMLNIQELATVKHHQLPIKMMVFENDGYSMIRGTYDVLKKKRVGVDKASGLELPNFCKVAEAFGIENNNLRTWEDFDLKIPWLLSCKGPALLQVHIDPEQQFVPRLKPIIENGKITPARFDQLSPLLEAA